MGGPWSVWSVSETRRGDRPFTLERPWGSDPVTAGRVDESANAQPRDH